MYQDMPLTHMSRNSIISAGILIIISACLSGIWGIIMLASSYLAAGQTNWAFSRLIIGVFGVVGLTHGLTGAVHAIARKSFVTAIMGTCWVSVSSIFSIFGLLVEKLYLEWLILSIPMLALSVLALALLAKTRTQFSQ